MTPEDLQFAELVVAQGLCSREKVDECVSFIGRLEAEGVTPVPRLGELLARKGYLTATAAVDATLRPSGGAAPTAAGQELPGEAARAAGDPANLLGKYVKVSRLGAGGMGEVWKGWDRGLRRWVALKFLHQADPAQQARFRREAQTAAALNHPNIASVYEVGDKDGKPFIAMQFVEGQTLSTHPRTDLRALVGLVRDAAFAVHSAHERGVIHRDLKPANLMVEGSRLYVMDFGLAKPTAVDSSLSVSGQILGTPAYMAPEQARGESARVTARSDVYALGATLYDLLADRPPFQETEVYALLRKVVDEEPVPLRKRSPRVARDLETIVMKCLEKDPDRRYATARELADDLARWLGGEAIQAHPPSAGYKVRKFVLRHRALVAMGAAAVLAVAILLPTWLREKSERRALAELAELRARMLMVKEWTRQSFRTPQEIRGALDREIARVGEYIVRHPRLPQGYYVRAQGHLLRGRWADSEYDLRQALRLEPGFAPAWALVARLKLDEYDRRLGGDTEQQVLANRVAGRPLLLKAQEALKSGWKEGADGLAIERWGLSRTPEDTVAERLLQALSEFYVENRQAEATRRLREAFAEAPAEEYCRWLIFWSPPHESPQWIDRAIQVAPYSPLGYSARSRARLDAGDVKGAVADIDAILSIFPDDPETLLTRAVAWIKGRDFEQALADCSRAIRFDRTLAEAWITRAAIQLKRRDFAAAERDATEGIRLFPEHPLGYVNRAGARLELRDHDGAIADASMAIDLAPELALGWTNRATARLNKGDPEGAAADLASAFALKPLPAEAYVTRAAVRLARNDFGGALEDSERALGIDPLLALAYSNRAAARTRLEEFDAALDDLQFAIDLDPAFALPFANRAGIYLLRDEWDPAIQDCDRALELDSKLPSAWSNRGAARHEKGDHDGAIADASRAIDLAPQMHEPYVIRGLARHSRKDLPAAIADFERCLKLAPGTWPHRERVQGWLKECREEKEK